jgi:hypothetical protein
MAAEVYHMKVDEDGYLAMDARIVEDGRTFYQAGYGDGSGHETFIRVEADSVEVFSGTATPNNPAESGIIPRIEHHDDIAELKPGDPAHRTVLLGPENNNAVHLSVRNIGETATRYFEFEQEIPGQPPFRLSLN